MAAKLPYGFSYIAVVATSDYTKSGHELAEANSVKLLSHHDLPRFDDVFSKSFLSTTELRSNNASSCISGTIAGQKRPAI